MTGDAWLASGYTRRDLNMVIQNLFHDSLLCAMQLIVRFLLFEELDAISSLVPLKGMSGSGRIAVSGCCQRITKWFNGSA